MSLGAKIGALMLGLLSPRAQEPEIAAIRERFRVIECCCRTLAIDAAVEVVEIDGVPLEPACSAFVKWRTRGGRTAIEVEGLDLDHGAWSGSREAARRARVYLPGGMTESLDFLTGSFSRDQRTYLDATSLSSDLGVGEFLWTFCGSDRSAILARRGARVTRVSDTDVGRCVEVTADDAAGSQRIVFDCVEPWGLLPRVASMLVRRSERWIELRRVEVRSVRATRLGYVPESASLAALRPDQAGSDAPESFRRLRAHYTFGAPEFAEVSVPHSVTAVALETRPARATDASAATPVAEQDPIFASSSVLFREPIATRAGDLDRFLSPLQGLVMDAGRADGRRSSWGKLGLGAALSALAGLFGLILRNRPLLILAALGSIAMVTAAVTRAIVESLPGTEEAYAALSLMEEIASEAPPISKTLCGVDCLYAAAALRGAPRADYAELVRLVRPGAQGTTLETLEIVAECLDLGPRLVNPRSFEAPPPTFLAHLAPSHFVVVVALQDGGVAVVDPGRGMLRARWSEVRGILSPAALVLRGMAAT